MATIVLDNTSVSPWKPPADCPPGVTLQIETWGAGSGGSGRVSTSVGGGGGGGGSYAKTFYKITAADVASGIAFSISAGGAGATNANSNAANATTFGTAPKNLIPNNSFYGASTSPSTLPIGWVGKASGLTITVVGLGNDTATGLPYIDLHYVGTTNSTNFGMDCGQGANSSGVPSTPSVPYTISGYMGLAAGSWTNITAINMNVQEYLSTGAFSTTAIPVNTASFPLTPTLVRFSGSTTPGATIKQLEAFIGLTCSSGVAVDITMRWAGFQIEQASGVTAAQLTPTAYSSAIGGLGTLTNAGALADGGGPTSSGNCYGILSFHSGGGATRALGGGGGAAAGPDGVGATSATATGATADNSLGGAANTSNVLGGGGGSGTAVAGATGSAAGSPGGGGGGSTASTGTNTGGVGGRGQVRLIYTPTSYGPQTKPYRQRHMLIR